MSISKHIDDFFAAAEGYPDIPEGKEVYVVKGEKAFEELRAKLRPFAPQAPLKSNVPAFVDLCWPWNVETNLESEMRNAACHYGGNLFYVPEGNFCLRLTNGIAVGEVYRIHLPEKNNPFKP